MQAPLISNGSGAEPAGQQLQDAWRELEELRGQAAWYRQKAALLELELTSAHRYAFQDELTGLPNRRLLADRFDQAVAMAGRRQHKLALLFLDLDGFKCINDTLGHAAGDELLQRFARRLAAGVRVSDTACRYGGDEFVVLMPHCKNQEGAVVAAKKLRARLASPYVIACTALRITASIGTALYPDDGETLGEVFHAADLSMYRNKARGPAPPNVPDSAATRKSLLKSLHRIQ